MSTWWAVARKMCQIKADIWSVGLDIPKEEEIKKIELYVLVSLLVKIWREPICVTQMKTSRTLWRPVLYKTLYNYAQHLKYVRHICQVQNTALTKITCLLNQQENIITIHDGYTYSGVHQASEDDTVEVLTERFINFIKLVRSSTD